jgi:hypothetical protein
MHYSNGLFLHALGSKYLWSHNFVLVSVHRVGVLQSYWGIVREYLDSLDKKDSDELCALLMEKVI